MATSSIDSTVFQQWTEDIEKARKRLGVQGTSVAVVHRGKIIYTQGFGKRNDIDPFTPETLVSVASITKGFTAAAIGELVAKGKAKWNAPVNNYLPEFELKDPRLTSEITFVDLLSHRTGLPAVELEWYHRTEPRIELIKHLKHVDAIAPLRAEWIYNNIMLAVAGEAASRIAGGIPYEQLVLETVVRPVGMTETHFSAAELATRPNHAVPYHCHNFEDAQNGVAPHRIPLDTTPMPDSPAGDMISNALELAQWARVMMHDGVLDGRQVLHKETVQAIETGYSFQFNRPRGPEFSVCAYGLCWILESYKGHQTVRHSGSNLGYRNNVVLFPTDDLAVIVTSNARINELPMWLPYYIADSVLNLPKTRDWLFDVAVKETQRLYKVNGFEDPSDLEAHMPPVPKDGQPAPPSRGLEHFAGVYTHPVAGKLVFRVVTEEAKDGTHTSTLAYEAFTFAGILDHHHADSFRLHATNELVSVVALVTFEANADNGTIQQCRLHRAEGTQVFTKAVQHSVISASDAKEE